MHNFATFFAPGFFNIKCIAKSLVVIDFFPTRGKGKVPGKAADLNVCENLGAILMDRVEVNLDGQPEGGKKKMFHLKRALLTELRKLASDAQLLEKLIGSFKGRMILLKDRNGLRLHALS